MKKILALAMMLLLVMTTGCMASDKEKGENGKMANRIAVFDTNKGTFEIELFEDKAPNTTSNFIKLSEEGFYDGVIFHRIIDGFMDSLSGTLEVGSICGVFGHSHRPWVLRVAIIPV